MNFLVGLVMVIFAFTALGFLVSFVSHRMELNERGFHEMKSEVKRLRQETRIQQQTIRKVRTKATELSDIEHPLAVLILSALNEGDDELRRLEEGKK